ncbi:MAG: hypothetical protein DI573_06905 [Microbacterium sp.]|uniref:DedA family protein n=1 Tax=Microbacterium sp. TaxID=51671 RepID=UPI000DB2108B|nr:VTT domain-containing protein [Microbacterium sp.]PZU39494.1 MAG: hypothetical protein DI573_06905 [Microbacterium sp.]
MISDALTTASVEPWMLGLLFALVLADSFLVVVPGEIAVTALGALSVTDGRPVLWAVVVIAAAAAFTGDAACYLVGRRVGLERWGWMRRPRTVAAFGWATRRLHRSTASILFTARFIPFARIAVNLTAGASRVGAPRYLAVSAGAATAWALYQSLIGAAVATLLPGAPVLAVVVSIALALTLGVIVDVLLARRFGAAPPT